MGYQKNSDDNGRIGGTFDDFTSEHVVGKFEYKKRDRSYNDKMSEDSREFENELFKEDNDTSDIVKEVTNEDEVVENG